MRREDRNYQGTKRPVVPVIVDIVVVDMGQTTIVGIATIETRRSAHEILRISVPSTNPRSAK